MTCATCGHSAGAHSLSGYRPCLGTWDEGECPAMCQGFVEGERA